MNVSSTSPAKSDEDVWSGYLWRGPLDLGMTLLLGIL